MLNQEQQQAVQHHDGPLLVLAGAGSGKTRVVTERIVRLIESGVCPSKILGVTFTNKAAGEMNERVQQATDCQVLISTFHSLGARILRESIGALGYRPSFQIYDEEDSSKLLMECLKQLDFADSKVHLKNFRWMISQTKNDGSPPKDAHKRFPEVYEMYQSKLKACNAVDFDDLLYLPLKLFATDEGALEYYQNRWSYLLIDEYQDTNHTQNAIVQKLGAKHGNIFAVGDPDQSIYSWRGAQIENILQFEQAFPGAEVVRLEQNYRSTQTILDAANTVIRHNALRYDKNLFSNRPGGEKITVHSAHSERDEARVVIQEILRLHEEEGLPLSQIVVFYRTNGQSRVFEDQLLMRRIPYTIFGGLSFYQRKEIKDVIAFLRMIEDTSDYIAFLRSIHLPKRGLGDTTLEKLRRLADDLDISVFTLLERITNEQIDTPLRLTARQKKGIGEYVDLINNLRSFSMNNPLMETVKQVIEETGYIQILAKDKQTFDDKKGNVSQLINKAAEWQSHYPEQPLQQFLEDLSLKSGTTQEEDEERISLMTIHNGKGLEFDAAFLCGMEEDLFPHVNAKKEPAQVEEERRLFYVGITRARKHLFITRARTRFLWGQSRPAVASRFLKELPKQCVQKSRTSLDQWDEEQSFRDEPVESEGSTFAPGATVFHPRFGVGKVQDVGETSMGTTYTIFFTKDGESRRIVAKLAQLTAL